MSREYQVISAYSRHKCEYEPKLGATMLGRALPGKIYYPDDYGFVPSQYARTTSLGVIMASHAQCSSRLHDACALEVLEMSGQEGVEPHIFVVSADNPRFEDFHSLGVVPEQNLRVRRQKFLRRLQVVGVRRQKYRTGGGL